MKKHIASGKSRNMKRKMKEKSGSNKYGLFAVPLAIAVSIVMVSAVFIGQNNDFGDEDQYPDLGNSVSRPDYIYGDRGMGTFERPYQLAYKANDDGTTCSVHGWNSDFDKPSGELIIPSTVSDGGIPYKVTSIGSNAFNPCTDLTSVSMPYGITSIGTAAFFSCYGLTSIDIPDSVISIELSAFNRCRGLTSVTIPDSVTSIGNSAFNGCTGLTSVTIPNSVTSIGNSAFNGCTGLTEIGVGGGNTKYTSHEGVLYNKDGTILTAYPAGKTDTDFTVPSSVGEIGEYAFNGCTNLTSVDVGDHVTKISNTAFNGCTGLTEIKVDETNTNYTSYEGILYNKDETVLVRYPEGKTEFGDVLDGVTSIEHSAFSGCTGLTSISIPESITSIGSFAFSGCTGLESIVFRGAGWDSISFGGNSFGLGSDAESVTCTVYSRTVEEFLNPYKNLHTEFIYETYNHQVTFEMNGYGTQVESQSVLDGDPATEPPEPSATVYTFAGWFINPDFSGTAYDFTEQVVDGITLYAK